MITKRISHPTRPVSLRDKAEKFLSEPPPRTPKASQSDIKKLIRELEAHQVELQMQNDELRKKQEEIEESRNRYVDLFDFAPIGYLTLDPRGKITGINLTGAQFLDFPRDRLVGTPFAIFVNLEFRARFNQHLMNVFSNYTKQTCELKMSQKHEKSLIYVSLESVAFGTGEDATCRSAVIDITGRKLAEEELLRTREELSKTNDQLRALSTRLLASQEDERKRVAYEVHDGFSSQLYGIKHRLQQALDEGKYNGTLEEVLNQLDAVAEEARRIQMALRPSVLDDLGIFPALNWFCREFQRTYSGIHIEKEYQLEEGKIPDSIKTTIFRIAQEAFGNIARHSKADSASISLTKKNSFIDLVIRDNGGGFDVDETLSRGLERGLGLSSMKERALLSGGLFQIESTLGKGTILLVSWPFA